MYDLTICIPTYKRPRSLNKLIQSISECNDCSSLVRSLNLIVVDNDIDLSAKDTVDNLIVKFGSRFGIHYFGYSVKGLSNVRNELIRRALQFNPDFIIFIDDDEYVTSGWINSLTETIVKNDADAARGPVFAKAESIYPECIWTWFDRESYADNSRIYSFTTGNLILRVSSLLRFDVWFDSRFNKTGFEDSYFGIQMLKKGAKIFWSAKAVTFETIPGERANLKWLMLRTYNGAATYTYMLKLEKEYSRLCKKIAISVINVLIGMLSIIGILLPLRKRYWSLIKISEGMGGFAGLLSIKYNEYK